MGRERAHRLAIRPQAATLARRLPVRLQHEVADQVAHDEDREEFDPRHRREAIAREDATSGAWGCRSEESGRDRARPPLPDSRSGLARSAAPECPQLFQRLRAEKPPNRALAAAAGRLANGAVAMMLGVAGALIGAALARVSARLQHTNDQKGVLTRSA